MLAYFSIIIEPDGSFEVSQGSLVKLPPELSDNFRVQKYKSTDKDGWTASEFGYLLLRRTDSFGRIYILPGLHLEDGPKAQKRFHGYKPANTKRMVEEYLDHHISRSLEQRKLAEESTTALVHDLRHLSSAIYHSAEQAGRAHADKNNSELADSLKTIVATQTMLKARIDYLDYTTGVDRFQSLEKIPVYSRVDKVVRCFRAAAAEKSIEIQLSGQSYRLTRGPNILDIVPYVLVDNALKYSPRNEKIDVSVYDLDKRTVVSVSSIGPVLRPDEREMIFETGFRGRNASALRPSGTGIGLSVAREILEKFSGELGVHQAGEALDRGGIAYQKITFTFSVPSSGEDKYRMKRSAQRKKYSIKR